MSDIELRAVSKSFGSHQVLHDIDLTIAEGEFVVLVGPSGCGKSTLLRMIAGLETITSGTLKIGGRLMNDVEARERDIAMVFQSYALYPHMSVKDNIGFPLRIRGRNGATVTSEVLDTAATIGMDGFLDRKPKELSGGQRQRVAMGRAIIRDPQLFLFDEPLSNLDAKLRVQMRQQVRSLHRRLSSTSVYVTHDQVEAMTLADRIVLLRDGRVQQVGTPMELYELPANIFVGGFIGSPEMNFMEATMELRGGKPICSLADGTVVEMPDRARNLSQRRLVLAIRPQDITLGVEGIPGKVLDIEVLGAETHIVVSAAGTQITCALRGMNDIELGQGVHLAFDTSRLHCFDPETTSRLP